MTPFEDGLATLIASVPSAGAAILMLHYLRTDIQALAKTVRELAKAVSDAQLKQSEKLHEEAEKTRDVIRKHAPTGSAPAVPTHRHWGATPVQDPPGG